MKNRLWWANEPKEVKHLVDRSGFLDMSELTGPPALRERRLLQGGRPV